MSDLEARGEEFEKEAEKVEEEVLKKLSALEYEDADSMVGNVYRPYLMAVKCYMAAKNWEKAAAAYMKQAVFFTKTDSPHEAAPAYVDAAECYKKYSMPDAARALNEAVNHYLEIDRLNMASSCCKELGESYESFHDLEKAMDSFERAADIFQRVGVLCSVYSCKQRAAQLAAQLEQYPKAVEIFEEVAQEFLNNNLLKYSAKGILFNAGICQLCKNDSVAISNSLKRYQEIDPTFSGTREYKLLADLATLMEEEDVEKFTSAIHEYDNMTRLDAWKTTLLLRVKNALKAKEEEEMI